MPDTNHAIREYFLKLNLEPEIADIYLALHAYGPQTISMLSRHSGVERTRIYRLLETLKATNLIEVETHYKRNILKAAHIGNLQTLLSKKKQDLRELQDELRSIERTLNHSSMSSELTRVHFYQGAEGTKQMFWNQTRATTETLSILYENMQGRTKSTFFERWVARCNERNMHFRGIIGQHFIQTQQQWYAAHVNERLEHWESRYAAPELFAITHSTIVYNDVVAYYNWKDGEVFGIEIYNSEIADTQRQFFEMLWTQCQPVDDLKGPQA